MLEFPVDSEPEIMLLSCCKTQEDHVKHLKIREAIKLLKTAGYDISLGGFKQ